MAIVLRKLAESDPSFLERFAQHPAARGPTRRYIGRTRDELYPNSNNANWSYQFEKLPGGWLVATHNPTTFKRELIDQAVEFAGWSPEDIVLPF